MAKCEYESVFDGNEPPDQTDEGHNRSWKPFLRQLQISSCVWSTFFQLGLCVGATTVLIPHMREEHGEQYVTRDMASWISCAVMYAGIPWAPVIVFLASTIGRRYTFALGTITSLVGFAVLSVGDTPLQVLSGMIIQGPLASLIMTITMLIMTEYISPVYRGVFLTIKSATVYWGIWVGNAIGTVAHWHYIAWLGMACAIYNLVNVFAWPESPFWLASKGRLEQCRKAHWRIKGRATSSMKELEEIIKGNHQSEDIEEDEQLINKFSIGKLRQVCHEMRSKCFYKSLLLNAALAFQYHFTGKVVCTVYAIDIIKDITKSKHEAYKGMLILDGVTVLGMYIGCGLSKKLTRRILLISAGGAGSMFLIIMSVYLFLLKLDVMSESKYITIALLTCYSISVSFGPIILNSTLMAELLPLRLRGIAALIVAMGNNLVWGTTLKIAPYVFAKFGNDGAFLFYGLISGSLLVVLYLYLPETKDRTLKEIQDLILGIKTDGGSMLVEMKDYESNKV